MERDKPAAESEKQNMSWGELAKLLGVKINDAGDFSGMEFFNACLGVHSSQVVNELPEEERKRVIRSAVAAVEILFD